MPHLSPRARLLLALLCLSLVPFYFGITEPILSVRVNSISLVRDLTGSAFDGQTDEQVKGSINGLAAFVGARIDFDALEQPSTQSVITGIKTLWRVENYLPALIILLLSVMLPIIKTLAMVGTLLAAPRHGEVMRKLIGVIHKWAMVDVFVIGVIVFSISTNRFVKADAEWGLAWFFAYFVISQVALQAIRLAPEADGEAVTA